MLLHKQRKQVYYMKSILYIVGIISGFMFPATLISAIRDPDDTGAEKSKLFSCILFGIIITSVLTIASY